MESSLAPPKPAGPANPPTLARWATAACVLLASCAGLALMHRVYPLVDEGCHMAQVYIFLKGEARIFYLNATSPAYHSVLFAFAWLTRLTGNGDLRILSLLMSLPGVYVFHRISRRLQGRDDHLRTLQFFFLPLLFPYFFLIYTDTFAILFLLMALWMVYADRPWLAGAAAILSVVVRQNQIIWLAMFLTMLGLNRHSIALDREIVLDHLRRGWVFLLGMAAFVVFVWLNQGVAFGDKTHHPAMRLSFDNVFFLPFAHLIAFLPLHLANAGKVVSLIRRRPWVAALVLAGFVFYYLTFHNDHPYNIVGGFIRNDVLCHIATSRGLTALFFLPIAYATLSMAVTPLHRATDYLIYPTVILTLIPEDLIDQRYYLPMFVFFLLMRRRESDAVEWSQLVYSVALGGFLLWGISHYWFLPL